MSAESVISKRLIKDHIFFHKLKPYTIEGNRSNDKNLQYQHHLESEKKKKITANLIGGYYIFRMTFVN